AAVVAHRAGQPLLRFGLLVGIAALTVPLLYVTPSTREAIPAATTQQCETVTDSLTLCLPRAKEVVRPQLAPEFEQAIAALQGLVNDHVTVLDDEAAGLSPAIDQHLATVVEREDVGGAEVIPLSFAGDISSYTRINRNSLHLFFISYLVR